MNNDHTLTAIKDRLAEVRDSLGAAHPSIPASEIIARARRSRVRRRVIPGMTAVLALAAGAAVAMTTLLPASHPASRHPRVQLAAWTVTRQPGGNIKVTIRELHNPAGLQRRLRVDGVAASVTFLGQENPACQPWPGAPLHGMSTPAGTALFNKVFPPTPPGAPPGVIVIHPSALPSGGGVQLAAGFRQSGPPHSWYVAIGAGLVHASKRCTGS
jgi:hypothetical protein